MALFSALRLFPPRESRRRKWRKRGLEIEEDRRTVAIRRRRRRRWRRRRNSDADPARASRRQRRHQASTHMEAAAAAAGGCSSGGGDGVPVASLPDHKLLETMENLLRMISDGFCNRLPDRGKKLHARLRLVQDEMDQRKLARQDNGECRNALDSNAKPSTSAVHSESLRSTSPGDCRGKKKPKLMLHGGIPSEASSALGSGVNGSHDSSHLHFQGGGNCPSSVSSSVFKRKCGSIESSDSIVNPDMKANHTVFLDEDDEDDIEDNCMRQLQPCSEQWKKAKIYYPSRGDPEAIELSYKDIECLEPEAYISSPIMNFYIRYLQSTCLIDVPSGEHYFFNTFFYHKLEEAISTKSDGDHFLRLRRWWKGVNIFQKAYIFLPIHSNLHWSLAVICFPDTDDGSGPIILHLDSLGLHNSDTIFRVTARYLKEEWECMSEYGLPSNFPISERIWKALPERIEKRKVKVPQQKNEYDCGLFVLYYMERFIKDYPGRLRRKDLDTFGRNWFRPEDASNLRQQIRDLLIHEFGKAKATGSTSMVESPAGGGDNGDDGCIE